MIHTKPIDRRRMLKLGAAATALPLVHIRTAGAAGKLNIGVTDHWVKAGDAKMSELIAAWSDKNKVDVQVAYLTGTNLEMMAAESVAHTGHDMLSYATWMVHQYADQLEPMDDVMGRLIAKYGDPNTTATYLAKVKGTWRAVPTARMSKNMASLVRADVLKQHCGVDVQAMYPAKPIHTPESEAWNWDNLLPIAQKCQAAGMPLGLTLSNNGDAVDWCGSLFAGFGAQLVDANGQITVRSDAVRQVLTYAQKLVKLLDPGVFGWDGAGNNRALISGKAALIFDAPSSWSVARTDAPQVAENCWEFPNPKGTAGRFVPYNPQFYGVWNFGRNKSAAKDLVEYLSQREQVHPLADASNGYDIPPFQSMTDFDVWQQEAPPPGVLYNYPVKPFHHADTVVAGYPAPPEIAVQIYTSATMPMMIARLGPGGQSVDQVIAWAEAELQTYSR
ncbi:MAG TPA: extracellular solute-binding protein [Acetobacteraceae bacterium]